MSPYEQEGASFLHAIPANDQCAWRWRPRLLR